MRRLGQLDAWLGPWVIALCATIAPPTAAQDGRATPPPSVTHPVAFETPYKLGSRPTLQSDTAAKAEEEALARWNAGGRDGTWHPQPRVIVDGVRVRGSLQAASVQATARAKGYWLIRSCYDPALPAKPTLRGKMSVQFTIRHSGTVVRPTLVGKPTLDDADVVRCIRDSLRKISFPRTRRGDAKAQLSVTVNPGDAPMRPAEDPPVTPGPGSMSMPTVQALVARHAGAGIQRCFIDGTARMPGLWGRLVLRLDVAQNGAIRSISEIESTFPDPRTTSCAIDAIRPIGLPPPKGGDVRIVVPIRLGHPH